MRLLLISILYSPEPSGVGPYSAGLASWLVSRGHSVSVIAANPSYPHWKLYPGYGRLSWSRATESGVDVHRVPVYIPRRVTAIGRVLHYISFTVNAFLPALRVALTLRPQVVLLVAPTLIATPVALVAASISRSTGWLHVQDFEVGAALGTGQILANGFLARLATRFEKWCVSTFDVASSISREMCARLVDLGLEPKNVYEFRNWSNIDLVKPACRDTYRSHFSIKHRYVALYSGSIAKKQGIELILQAASLLASRKDLVFVICGDGPDRVEWERQAAVLDNVLFFGLQPYERLGDLLAMADLHLLPQLAGVADMVLPSKLTNMLASGRPVVATAELGTGLYAEVNGCGLISPPGDSVAFSAAIDRLLNDAVLIVELGAAARIRAEERWASHSILSEFETRLVNINE